MKLASFLFIALVYSHNAFAVLFLGPADVTPEPGVCTSNKDFFVTEIAKKYGATLQWSGANSQSILGTVFELYTATKGWALLKIEKRSGTEEVCFVDGGFTKPQSSEPYDCDHDSSINDLVRASGPLVPSFWGRSSYAKRSYVFFVENTSNGRGKWAFRGSGQTLSIFPSPTSSEKCVTKNGDASTLLRLFK